MAQLQIAFTIEDVADMLAAISKKEPVITLAGGAKGGRKEVARSGERSPSQLWLHPSCLDEVLALAVTATPSRYDLANPRVEGMVVEVEAVRRDSDSNDYTVGGVRPGRIYYRGAGNDPCDKLAHGIYRRATSWVRRNCPLRTPGRVARYLGPHLAAELEAGARVCHPSGKMMVFE